MKIAILADQHGALPKIPECDLMILSGDITGGCPAGKRDDDWEKWIEWLCTDFSKWIQDAPFTVMTPGNHDTCFEKMGCLHIPNAALLIDEAITWNRFKIYGSPWTRQWDNLAFNVPECTLREKWKLIPKDADILVLHQPPAGAGDQTVALFDKAGMSQIQSAGCPILRNRIEFLQPLLVTCGHIHEGRGEYEIGRTKVVNASGAFTVIEL